MKFFSFLLAVILCLSLTVTSFASEVLEPLPDSEPVLEIEYPATSGNDYLDMVLNGMQNQIQDMGEKIEVLEDELSEVGESNSVSVPSDQMASSEEPEEINPDTDLPASVALMSVAPITPEDSSGLKAVLLSVIGDYDPVIVEYRYQNSNQTSYQYLREVLPDYPWCASFLMLALFVYCTFRLGGALID